MDYDQAMRRLAACDPDADDATICAAGADYYIARADGKYVHFSIYHDTRKRACKGWHFELLSPEAKAQQRAHSGICLIGYDWTHKNCVGISTQDRERARRWVDDALFFGYKVTCRWGRHGGGWGISMIDGADGVREKIRELRERRAASALV